MLLPTPALRTVDLSWDRPTRRFVTEASNHPNLRVGRVWDDAADVGLTLVGRDGRTVRLVESHQEVRDGDLLWTDFTPVCSVDLGVCAGLRIWND